MLLWVEPAGSLLKNDAHATPGKLSTHFCFSLLKVSRYGQQGLVCGWYLTKNIGNVICKQLNMGKASMVFTRNLPSSSLLVQMPILVKQPYCRGEFPWAVWHSWVLGYRLWFEPVENTEVIGTHWYIYRELKQARTATAVNKQLNFFVKNKPHTTDYIYCIFEAYFMTNVWERTVLTVLKSNLSNVYQHREGCRRAEDGKILIFTSSGRRQSSRRWKVLLKIDFKTVNTVLSQTFNHKICFKYAIRRRSQLFVVSL